MNPENRQNPQEQMEVRLVALLLGEASAFEEAELQQAMTQDASLAAYYQAMCATIGLVQEASKKSPAETNPGTPVAQPKLSEERRGALLAKLKAPRPVLEKGDGETEKRRDGATAEKSQPKMEAKKGTVIPLPKSEPWPLWMKVTLRMAAVFVILGMLAALLLPATATAKKKAQRITALNMQRQAELEERFAREEAAEKNASINNLRAIDGAKEEWAMQSQRHGVKSSISSDGKPQAEAAFGLASNSRLLSAAIPSTAGAGPAAGAKPATSAGDKVMGAMVFLPKGEPADATRVENGREVTAFDGATFHYDFQSQAQGQLQTWDVNGVATDLGATRAKGKFSEAEGEKRSGGDPRGTDQLRAELRADKGQLAAGWGRGTPAQPAGGTVAAGQPAATENFGLFEDQNKPLSGTDRYYRVADVGGTAGGLGGQGGGGGAGGKSYGGFGGGGYGGGLPGGTTPKGGQADVWYNALPAQPSQQKQAGDWMELSNFGTQPAQLSGWKFNEGKEGGGEVTALFRNGADGTYALNPAAPADPGKSGEKARLAVNISAQAGAMIDPATGKPVPVQWGDFDSDGLLDVSTGQNAQAQKADVDQPAANDGRFASRPHGNVSGPAPSSGLQVAVIGDHRGDNSKTAPALGDVPLMGGLFAGRVETRKANEGLEENRARSSGPTVYSVEAVGFVDLADSEAKTRQRLKDAGIQAVAGSSPAAPVIPGGNGIFPGSDPAGLSAPVATTATPATPAEPAMELAPLPVRYPEKVALKGMPDDFSSFRREESVTLKAEDRLERFDDIAARNVFAIKPAAPPPPPPANQPEPARPALLGKDVAAMYKEMAPESRRRSLEESARQAAAEAKSLAEAQKNLAVEFEVRNKAGAALEQAQQLAEWGRVNAETASRRAIRPNVPPPVNAELGYGMVTNVYFGAAKKAASEPLRDSLAADKEVKDLPAVQMQTLGLGNIEKMRREVEESPTAKEVEVLALGVDAAKSPAETDFQKRLKTTVGKAAGVGELDAKDKLAQLAQNETRGLQREKADVSLKSPEKTKQQAEQVQAQLAKVADLSGERIVDTPVAKPPSAPPLLHQPEVATVANSDVNFSTFSLNVSDVAFKTAAASLEAGALPDPNSVRVEEFINAFNYRDPAPARGARLAFAWERTRYPFAHNRDLLRFAVQTAAQGREAAKPLNLVILLDNSGSMERPDRMQIVGDSLKVLAEKLQPQDKISVVAFSRTARLWVDGMAGGKPQELLNVVGGLVPQGGTDLGAGLELAYKTAVKNFMPKGNNRVIMLTDGAANLGDVSPDDLKKKVVQHRQKGIALDCFGIGWEGYNDDLLEVLSHNGDGRYSFLNDPEQAGPEFANQLAGALSVAASDVKAQVEFNPARVTAYRQIGYAKHQLTKQQFRDNTVDAAEIAASESGNALYVIQVNPEGSGPLGVVRVRHKVPDTGEYVEQEWTLPYQPKVPALDQAAAPMRLAAVSAAFGEWLARNPYAGEVNVNALPNYLNGVPEFFSPDPRPKQLAQMIQQAMALGGDK